MQSLRPMDVVVVMVGGGGGAGGAGVDSNLPHSMITAQAFNYDGDCPINVFRNVTMTNSILNVHCYLSHDLQQTSNTIN